MKSPAPENIPEELYQRIFEKAETRKQSGCDPISADWQAILEISLCLARNHLRKIPGRLLPLQIDNQNEWEVYLDLQEKLDLPPDTYAVLSTPSFSASLLDGMEEQTLGTGAGEKKTWKENAFLVILSDCYDHERIMQVSLPSAAGTAGIDVYEEGNHLADYTYNTIEECMNALAKVPWIFFSPKGAWTTEQIIQYTENWFVKSFDTGGLEGIVLHSDFSYVHHPELLSLTPMETTFKLLEGTIPTALESLDTAIRTTNELNQDMENEEALITRDGIFQGNPEHCQALADRIALDMDQQLDRLEFVEGIEFPDRNDREYVPTFEKTARSIYEAITGLPCPQSVIIW